jgi:hypothetical protein
MTLRYNICKTDSVVFLHASKWTGEYSSSLQRNYSMGATQEVRFLLIVYKWPFLHCSKRNFCFIHFYVFSLFTWCLFLFIYIYILTTVYPIL